MMTDTEAALLRAICEQPDDDTPRLVFADWLTERGGPVDAAWAKGIRAQIWRARGDAEAALAQGSKLFESPYGLAKLYEHLGLRPDVVGDWERGFPTSAGAPFVTLRKLWPGLAYRFPIRKLSAREVWNDSLAEFLAWPALSLLRELGFSAQYTRPRPAHVIPLLAGCPALKGLVTLRVLGAGITDDAVTAILDSPHLAGLKTCELRRGYDPNELSQAVRDRFRQRFEPDAVIEEAPIPF
jgi:uncharacterized protein (TIGR02996 family)